MLATAYYFLLNVTKIGDNLLTRDIAHEAGQPCRELIYFASRTAANVLGRFGVSHFALREIETEETASRIVHLLRSHRPVIDRRQLNSWFDWPQQRQRCAAIRWRI